MVYDGPSSALTPSLLGELYGSGARELFEPGLFGEAPAANAPGLPRSLIAT